MATKTSTLQWLTSHILMIRPANFGYNKETAKNNSFQHQDDHLPLDQVKQLAIQEFDSFVEKLRHVGIDVTVVEDTITPLKTDAVFPNNWISFHENGWVITYPMYSHMRRRERRTDIIDQLANRFKINHLWDLSDAELEGKFLEGTGSLVLDRQHKVAYACLAERTDKELIDLFCENMGYQKIIFTALDTHRIPIYHTNVMMAMGQDFVVICLDSIPNPKEREILLDSFAATNKEVIALTMDQLYSFAGNMIQLKNSKDEPYLVMSSQAFHSLNPQQISQLEEYTNLLYSDLKVIEFYSGGSARCMIAEIFLQERRLVQVI